MASLIIAAGPNSGTCRSLCSPMSSCDLAIDLARLVGSTSSMPCSTSRPSAAGDPGRVTSAGVRRAPSSQSGAFVVRDVHVRDSETVRECTLRPNEKNGIERPSAREQARERPSLPTFGEGKWA